MLRYVHHEFRLSLCAAAAVAVTLGVLIAVHGLSPLPDYWWRTLAIILGISALFVPLRASRIPGLSLVLRFDEAVPRHDPYGIYPTHVRLFRRTALRPMFVVFVSLTAITLAVCLLWTPDLIAGPLWLAVDWLCKGLVVLHWEYRHGARLWQGHDRDRPERFSYTTVNRFPPTRTATDAPPG